jgi:hypothetical protein
MPRRRWLVLLALSPDLIAPALAVFGAVAVIAAVLGLPGYLALVLCVVVAAAATWWLARRSARFAPADRTGVVATAVAWLLALVWTGLNVLVAGQQFIVERDPGFYATTGRYLADHNSYPLQTGTGALLAAVPGVTDAGAAYSPAGPGEVYSQGGPLLPLVLGHLQRVLGPSVLTWGNVLLAGLALVAFYAWCRRFLRGYWALLPPTALAVSLPFLFVARATYSEVLALALVTGGLALLTVGLTRATPWVAAAGAATMASSMLARIDGVAIAGIVVVATVGVWTVTSHAPPRRVRRTTLAALAATVAVILPSWWVYYVVAPPYLGRLWVEFFESLLALLGGTLVVALVAAAWPRVVAKLGTRRGRLAHLVARGVALLSAVALGYLTARPLWSEPHDPLDPTSGYQAFVAAVQQVNGVTVDPSRTYDEFPVVSTAWYYGWAALALAITGLLLYALRARRRVPARWAPVLGAVVAQIPLYFTAWHITPDQLWASRRLVGLGYPVLLVLAGYAAATLTALLAGALTARRRTLLERAAGGVLVVAVLGWTALVTRPLADVSDYRGFGTLVSDTCEQLDHIAHSTAEPVVVIVTGQRSGAFVRTVGVFCDVPSVVSTESGTSADEAAVHDVGDWAATHGKTAVRVDIGLGVAAAPEGGQQLLRRVPMTAKTLTHAPSTWAWETYVVTVQQVG